MTIPMYVPCRMHTSSRSTSTSKADPDKAAAVMIVVREQTAPPVQLFLGQDAYDLAAKKMESVKHKMDVMPTATAFEEEVVS